MNRIASLCLAALIAAAALWPAAAGPKSTYRDLPTLVDATMSAFVQALNARSMAGFAPRFVAVEGRSEKLERAYAGLYPHAEVFAQMRSYAPVVTALTAADDRPGMLVRGFYPGKYRISFEMLFVLEAGELKLSAFAVEARPMASLDA